LISSVANHERGMTNVSTLSSIRYILVLKFCELTGYTDKAVRRKIQEGIWIQGKLWRKAPDGHILIDLENYNKWVEGDTWLVASREAA
jgi:hypothetical protein